MEILREYEVMLHQFEVRKDVKQLRTLLHPEFIEIGYSGKTFDFDIIITDVPLEEMPNYSVWSQDFEFIELAPDVIQIIYREARMDEHGALSRHAKRTSIWTKVSGQWQIRFHQGTPTEAFDKSKA